MAFEVEHAVACSGGLRLADVAEVNRRLRRGLHGRDRDYVVPLVLASARSPDTRSWPLGFEPRSGFRPDAPPGVAVHGPPT
jgi:hypothetical protein